MSVRGGLESLDTFMYTAVGVLLEIARNTQLLVATPLSGVMLDKC